MKRLIALTLLCIISFGCTEDIIPSNPDKPGDSDLPVLPDDHKKLDITFDDQDIGILPGGKAQVGYKVTGASKPTVKALGQNGWSAKVIPSSDTEGLIQVNAPSPLTDDEIVVIVSDGDERTKMASINFVSGVVKPSVESIELSDKAGSFTLSLETNLTYEVLISDDASAWLSIVETKAMRTDQVEFSYKENPDLNRNATISIKYGEGEQITLSVLQKGQLDSSRKIYYTTTNNLPVWSADVNTIIGDSKIFGAKMISNEYVDGEGVMLFDAPLDSIGRNAFRFCYNLKTVVIPKSVNYIGRNAFLCCENCTEVEFPASLDSIQSGAFQGCAKLKEVILPEGVVSTGDFSFASCSNLEKVILPSTMKIIGICAFRQCTALKAIDIPNNATDLGGGFLNGCSNLNDIRCQYLTSDKHFIIKDGKLLSCVDNQSTSIAIPASVKELSAFSFCYLSNLKSIVIPDWIEVIGARVFDYCSNLQSVVLPKGIKEVPHFAFNFCENLTELVIPDGVTRIGNAAFRRCGKLNLTIPATVEYIGKEAFSNSAIVEAKIPAKVEKIEDSTFSGCRSLVKVKLPENIKEIHRGAFDRTSIEEITIPDKVVLLGESVFLNCQNLARIYCKSLTPPNLDKRAFERNADGRKIYVPLASVDAYKSASNWSEYAADIVGYDFSAQQ